MEALQNERKANYKEVMHELREIINDCDHALHQVIRLKKNFTGKNLDRLFEDDVELIKHKKMEAISELSEVQEVYDILFQSDEEFVFDYVPIDRNLLIPPIDDSFESIEDTVEEPTKKKSRK